MTPEKTLSEQRIHDGKVLSFAVRQVELPDGNQAVREVAINYGGVAIVALTADNEVRLVRQYRAASQSWVIELPAGSLQPDEDPALGAARELLEETGDEAATWQKLIGFYSRTGHPHRVYHHLPGDRVDPRSQQPGSRRIS